MSAESHHQKRAPVEENVRLVPNIVPPQAVSDRSIIDSVAGFINDVGALTNAPQANTKDQILWVKFENLADISDTCLGEDWDVEGNLPPPLLLCIGYVNGIQVWAVPANGEAIEVMSWKHGSVNILRILPTPFLSNNSELANDLLDQFIHKRPLMALCGECPNQAQATPSQQLHAVNFISLKDGDCVKTIRFKSPIVDVVANRTSIAITFHERIAIFDARTLEDRLTVTTCYPCPNGLCPIALGDRWLAYAERKLIPSKASAGGCYADGIPSYTATVLNAAKSLGKGLRELGEQVAAGLTGNAQSSMTHANQSNPTTSSSSSAAIVDGAQAGVVTILDIKYPIKDISPTSGTPVAINGNDPIIAHFMAHTEAVIAMQFDPSGMLLLTADRRGHDFNIFRIQPHPCGSVLAAVHHLYVLHRGDTSAKVQDISFSFDSRWVAVSTLRGTTHVFPITPYGGQCGFRTHSAPHVVNRLSRFHRSAGLPVDGRSSSPILMSEHAVQSTAYANPRLPPFPHPTVVLPLAQLRQPSSLNSTATLMSSSSQSTGTKSATTGRIRHHSTEESHSKPLRVAAVFAKARSWLLDPPGMHDTPSRLNRRAVDSLFVIAGHGALIQYDLEPRHASNIQKEKICDETPIELEVEAKAQWILGQKSNSQLEISPPLPADNWLIKDRVIDNNLNLDTSQIDLSRADDRWLSQVEIITHAGPHRRLWMGPQFVFKLYNTPSGHSLAHIDMESVEVGARARQSAPVNMPSITSARPLVPVLIESGSCSSHEQSPRLLDSFHYESTDSEPIIIGPDSQLKEDLADAMRDCAPVIRESGSSSCDVLRTETLVTEEATNVHTVVVSIVNPQGTITTVTDNSDQLEFVDKFSDNYILENCDETMFRPVITVMSEVQMSDDQSVEECSKPVEMPLELVVPVIDERQMEEKKRQKEIEKARKQQEMEAAAAMKIKAEEVKKSIEVKKDDSNGNKKGKKGQRNGKKWDEKKSIQKSSSDELKNETKKCEKIVKITEIVSVDEKTSEKCEIEEKIEESAVVEECTTSTECANKDDDKIEKSKDEQVIVEDDTPESVKNDDKMDNFNDENEQPVKIISFSQVMKNAESSDVKEELSEEKVDLIAQDELKLEKSIPLVAVIEQKEEPIVVVKSQVEVLQKPAEPEPDVSWKRNKKNKRKQQQPALRKSDEINLELPPPLPIIATTNDDDNDNKINEDAIMKISKHETIGDDEIQIIPHEEIHIIESPRKSSSDEIEVIDENFELPIISTSSENNNNNNSTQAIIKIDDFYDIDDDLPPLEPFDVNFDDEKASTSVQKEEQEEEEADESEKQEMKKKMSELLKDTNMVFAMCSSLKELKTDEDSSQIQRSTSSSLTTNTTTSTFASASSNQVGGDQGLDSDYKSLELEMEEVECEFKIPKAQLKKSSSVEKDDAEAEDVSSFEATSSETDADDSSKKSNVATKFKREDDEELRPLLDTSITSLTTLPVSSGSNDTTTTEANETPTLPELNQKIQATSNNNNNNNSGKRKNKKKRR